MAGHAKPWLTKRHVTGMSIRRDPKFEGGYVQEILDLAVMVQRKLSIAAATVALLVLSEPLSEPTY